MKRSIRITTTTMALLPFIAGPALDPPSLPNVYVDNMYYGDISVLRNIAAASIESIKFYNAAEAQYAFGRGNMAGVIGIVTKH